MTPNAISAREKLQAVRSFAELMGFLCDDLGWPIEAEDFEDAFFDFVPEELGIDPESAAKIRSIKRLRRMSDSQPWGVYFVDFEQKRLPVVALRRILSGVVLKRRASSNSSERAAWRQDDLLFIASWGDDEERHLSFAQFADPPAGSGLATLHVLGWDRLDTPLRIDRTSSILRDHLRWPEDVEDVDAWRSEWRSAFTLRHGEVVRTAKDLAERLASLAEEIRNRIVSLLEIETSEGPLTKIMFAFRESLIHDLSPADFADMYAQTVTYGLLSARIARPTGADDDLAAQIPLTNPFLRELMESFMRVGGEATPDGAVALDSDELGITEVMSLLDEVDMSAVLRDFGDRNPREDPVIHFYESFLKEYDPERRMKRGVFYTPRPVVRFIVLEADRFLRDELGLEYGLADTTTWGELSSRRPDLTNLSNSPAEEPVALVLDPATGTGTFLVEVIDLIFETMTSKWTNEGLDRSAQHALWNEYVPSHLLPRLHGYEVMMAPYAIAHVKIGLKLFETGYEFKSPERARVFLTNALEPPEDLSGHLAEMVPALAHEAVAVNNVKNNAVFSVVIGNPPYSDASQNLGPQFETLIEGFREYQGERIREPGAIRFEHAINNDYVKFWGLALKSMAESPVCLACMITSSSFLDGKSFRGVRDSMVNASSAIYVTDLHGEGWSGGLAHSGISDENVFEIQTGVSVTKLIRNGAVGCENSKYRELVGSAEEKSDALMGGIEGVEFKESRCDERRYLSFLPATGETREDYWQNPQLDSLFVDSVDGIKTSRDGLVIGNSFDECSAKIQSFMSDPGSDSDIEERYSFKANRFNIAEAQRYLQSSFDENKIFKFAYRPFDIRHIYYDRELIFSHRMNMMPGILEEGSESIVCASRLSAGGFEHALSSRTLCGNKYASHDVNSRMFPVVHFCEDLTGRGLRGNFRDQALSDFLVNSFSEDALAQARLLGNYLLCVLNTPEYSTRYFEEIRQDFPRIPRPASLDFLVEMAAVGQRMSSAFNLDVVVPDDSFVVRGAPVGEVANAPKFKNSRLTLGRSLTLEGVPSEVWEHRCGGYLVVKSWFSAGNRSGIARQTQPITEDLLSEFRRVLFSVSMYLECRAEADRVIKSHGGWTSAFRQV